MSDHIVVTDELIEESMNRAFGVIVNELRLTALRQKVARVQENVPTERIYLLAVSMIAGQFGHDELTGELSPIQVDTTRLFRALQKSAAEWGFAIRDDTVLFKVDKPRTKLPPS